jgi:hypothetical protein
MFCEFKHDIPQGTSIWNATHMRGEPDKAPTFKAMHLRCAAAAPSQSSGLPQKRWARKDAPADARAIVSDGRSSYMRQANRDSSLVLSKRIGRKAEAKLAVVLVRGIAHDLMDAGGI